MYEEPNEEISFGDIFAAEWFFDAYLRRDAVPLVEFTAKVGRGWKAAAPSRHRDALLAHGLQRRAVMLSDDCEVETILRRGGRSRLIFAAIEELPVAPSQAEEVLKTRSFRRFPLPPADGFPGGIVEFQQSFAVGIDGVKPADEGDPRVARLDSAMRVQLEIRWNAYASRRGPLTHLDNAEKLARLLAAGSDAERLARLKAGEDVPGAAELNVAKAVAEALSTAWDIEGAVLNTVAEAYEVAGHSSEAVDRLADALKQLGSRAQRAAALLGPDGGP
jgi:hypothetical protein